MAVPVCIKVGGRYSMLYNGGGLVRMYVMVYVGLAGRRVVIAG